MKVTKQDDGLYTIEADNGKVLEHKRTHLRTHLAADQTDKQVKDWNEVEKVPQNE